MKTMNKLAILASVLLSAACAPAAKLADSSVELPERYPAASGTDTTTVADVSWTEFFPDTLLQRHIRTALEGNFSFLNCMNRIRLAENGKARILAVRLCRAFRRAGKIRGIYNGRCRQFHHQHP